MDQIKTGKFIAEERKLKGFTQRQLADRLGISDKTVSKWERGGGFPEVSLLLPLCGELGITVNELLTGHRLASEDYKTKAEENMVNLVKEAQESKKKIILAVLVGLLALAGSMPLFLLTGYLPMETWLKGILIGLGCLILLLGVLIACFLENEAGAFECPVCHERFVPSMGAYLMGPHTILRRRLKCPKCGAVKYCKKVLTK